MNDPDERTNLAAEGAAAAHRARLEKMLLAWRKETADPLLDPAMVDQWATIVDHPQKALEPWFRGGQKERP